MISTRTVVALQRAYALAMQAAIARFGKSKKDVLVIEDIPRFLELVESLPQREQYVMGSTNLFEELVASVAEGSTPAVRAFVLGTMRVPLVEAFSFAVPNEAALRRIAALGPLVEVGCGTAYWARCLHEMGAKVAAYDRFTVETLGKTAAYHHQARLGDPAFAIASEPWARTLLLCWPVGILNAHEDKGHPRYSKMGEEALAVFAGDHVVFIGEKSGSFGSPAFFAQLDHEYRLLERIVIPTLAPWNDAVWLFQRRARPGS